MSPVWSWVLGLPGAGVLLLVGDEKTKRLGWTCGLALQAVWYSYAITTGQWGFVVSATAFTLVNARGLVRWHHQRRAHQAAGAVSRPYPLGRMAQAARAAWRARGVAR